MASQPIEGKVLAFPAIPPMPAVARILSGFQRGQLASFIEVAISLLDTLDGPEDAEDDDPPGQCDEDEVNTTLELAYSGTPGCIISDDDREHDGTEQDDDGVNSEPALAVYDAETRARVAINCSADHVGTVSVPII